MVGSFESVNVIRVSENRVGFEAPVRSVREDAASRSLNIFMSVHGDEQLSELTRMSVMRLIARCLLPLSKPGQECLDRGDMSG